MARLIYSMITSLDGYAASDGDLGFGGGDDEEAHTFMDTAYRSVRTYLYGRRMYETMVFWETADAAPDAPPFIADYARGWQAADKIVYSTTLESASSARTTIERTFDPEAVRRLKRESQGDLSVSGPTLGGEATRAGLVDEFHLFLTSRVVGSGIRFFPEGVTLDLELLEERRFASGLLFARYRNR